MMNVRRLLAVIIGLAMALAGFADPIAEATYAQLFGRAQALIPGMTTLEADPLQAGAWEFVGGRRLDQGEGLTVTAQTNSVELVWKGVFPRALPSLNLTFRVEASEPVRVMLHDYYGERFNLVGGGKTVEPGAKQLLEFNLKGKDLGGFKLVVEDKGLAGKTIRVKDIKLSADIYEGYFRREVTLPDGAIWEAVAEVGNMTALHVNGQLVDDETVIMPRPVYRGGVMYQSKRVPLKSHLKPGKNVVGLYVMRAGSTTMAYFRGSIIMASGERILLDSGTNWVWNRAAPANWLAGDYNAAGWLAVKHAGPQDAFSDLMSRKCREAFAVPATQISFNYRPRGDMPAYDGCIKLRNPGDTKYFFDEKNPFALEVAIPPGFKDGKPELAWEINRYEADGAFAQIAQGRLQDFKLLHDGGLSSTAMKNQEMEPACPQAGQTGVGAPRLQSSCGLHGDSLIAEINSVKLDRGIYVLTSRLLVNGRIVEEREPEPLVMTGKVKMPLSAGDTLEQGMDLTLEQTIDFTDPRDPHPWFETDVKGLIPRGIEWGTNYYHTVEPALIVERGGLKYRVTRKSFDHRREAQFSYKVDFAHAGDWYLLVLEYPDDAERWIGVSCNAASRMSNPKKGKEMADGCSKCGPAIWTGGKYPNTGKMLEMKWIYRPDPGSHAINVLSLMKDADAAAARLRIYHIKGRLPELDAGDLPLAAQRRFGMLTERTYPYQSGIYNLFSSFALDDVPSSQRADTGAGAFTNNALREACARLRLMEDTARHYAEYMRFAGHNLHTMGCYQYTDRNTAPQYLTGDPRLQWNPHYMLARVLQANDLRFYASVEFFNTFHRESSPVQKPEWFFSGRTGGAGWQNFLHPEIEHDMLAIARQLAEEFKAQPNFLGVNWTAYFGGAWLPSYRSSSTDPLAMGYDDFTVGLFEKETGIKAPGSGEQWAVSSDQGTVNSDQSSVGSDQSSGVGNQGTDNREPGTVNHESAKYEQRYQFLTSAEMKPRWLAWRAQKMVQFFEKMNRVIRAVRPDLETVASCYLNYDHIAEWQHKQMPFGDYLGEWGWNPELFKERPGLWLMPWLHPNARYQPAYGALDYAMAWQGNHDPEFYRPLAGLDKRALMLCVAWIEVEGLAANYPYRPGWPRPYQQTMMGQQREEMAMEPYTQALIGFDPQMVMMGFTDVSPYIGVEGMQRKFTRVLRRLPWDRFEPVLDTGFDSNLAIRALRQGADYCFYVANPGYWPINGQVTLVNVGEVVDVVSGKIMPMKDGVIEVALDPFGVAAFRATPGSSTDHRSLITDHSLLPQITAWTTAPVAEKELAHMRQILAQAQAAAAKPDVADFLGDADYGVLTGTVARVDQALSKQHYAKAWAAVTDAFFWAVLFQKIPEMQFADIIKSRAMSSVCLAPEFAPKIDGILNDRVWEEKYSKPMDEFVTKAKVYSDLKTFVRLARTRDRLFIAFECRDPEPDKIRGVAGKDDEKLIWEAADDTVACFIMPDGTNYYQLAVSAGGAKFDQRCRSDGLRDYDYAPKWRAAVHTNDQGWTVEIELDVADAFGKTVEDGVEWKVNFHRLFRLNQRPYASWVYSPNWHAMANMGTVKFE